MEDLLYYVDTIYGQTNLFCYRQKALEYYRDHNGTRLYSKTKDLFPKYETIIDRPQFDIRNLTEDNMEKKTTVALRNAVSKYDQANTKQIKLKLNKEKDKEILEKLETCGNIQGYIKELIKKDIGIS